MAHWVYIQTNKPRGTLYVGKTSALRRRSKEHRSGRGSAFTRKYGLKLLVWYERYESKEEADQRERTMKEWPRAWKINLVERLNPTWTDLSPGPETMADGASVKNEDA